MTSKNLILTLLLIGVVVVLGTLGVLRANAPTTDQSLAACTEEALMCPDGSAVGRAGPACEFTACPNSGSFTGIVDMPVEGTYYLRMKSVLPNAKEPYIMPIDFSLSSDNTYQNFINQTVSVDGKFLQGNKLMVTSFGSSVEPTTPLDVPVVSNQNPPQDTSTYTLGKNEVLVAHGTSKSINGLTITVNKLVSDSRCPADALCIQAGWVEASVTVSAPGVSPKTTTMKYAANTPPYNYNNYSVSIVNVTPDKYIQNVADKSAYSFVFHVEKAMELVSGSGSQCTKAGGVWDATYRECGGIDTNKCSAIGGTFNECGSACRHNPKAEMCTMQCVQFCQM